MKIKNQDQYEMAKTRLNFQRLNIESLNRLMREEEEVLKQLEEEIEEYEYENGRGDKEADEMREMQIQSDWR